MPDELQFLTLKQVMSRVALSRSCIYEAMSDKRFPRPYRLGRLTKRGKQKNGKAVRWLLSDVERWMQARIGNGGAS